MTNSSTPPMILQQEWELLHEDHERYDRNALYIKLAAIICCALSLAYQLSFLLGTLFVLTLWLQEGIWRTFQSRIADRLMLVEQGIKSREDVSAFQLYSSWEQERPSTMGLIKSYISNSVRPTVAFPYIILLCIEFIVIWLI